MTSDPPDASGKSALHRSHSPSRILRHCEPPVADCGIANPRSQIRGGGHGCRAGAAGPLKSVGTALGVRERLGLATSPGPTAYCGLAPASSATALYIFGYAGGLGPSIPKASEGRVRA